MKNHPLALLATLVTLTLGLLGIGGYVVAIAADNARTKEKVDAIEKRSAEERTETRRDTREIKREVKETNEAVQVILRKLDSIEASQKAAEKHR